MADKTIAQLTTEITTPADDDLHIIQRASDGLTGKIKQKNVVEAQRVKFSELVFDHVASGGVWTADSAGVTRAASMTAMTIYINGRRLSISAVTSRTFTASKDTYIDVLDNQDGTGTLVYTEVANNAASPALAANSTRVGIIVTGAGSIAAAASINQGQEDRILPIASSIPYAVTDSLGNLICPRDPARRTLGYRQITTGFSTASATAVQITALSVPVIVPTGRKIELELFTNAISNGTAAANIQSIWDGVVASGTQLAQSNLNTSTASAPSAVGLVSAAETTPAAASKTYNAGLTCSAGTVTENASSTSPAFLRIRLV